jgi:hypothetical protein
VAVLSARMWPGTIALMFTACAAHSFASGLVYTNPQSERPFLLLDETIVNALDRNYSAVAPVCETRALDRLAMRRRQLAPSRWNCGCLPEFLP